MVTSPQVLIQRPKAAPEALIPNTLLQQTIFQRGQSAGLCKMSGTQSTQNLREMSLKGEALVQHAPLLTRDLLLKLVGWKVTFPNRTPEKIQLDA